jgi:hypothetical protein
VAAVPIVMLGIEMKRFRDLDEVLAHLPNNMAVGQLDLTPMPPSMGGPIPGASSRALSHDARRFSYLSYLLARGARPKYRALAAIALQREEELIQDRLRSPPGVPSRCRSQASRNDGLRPRHDSGYHASRCR